jgi:hypothetical protein
MDNIYQNQELGDLIEYIHYLKVLRAIPIQIRYVKSVVHQHLSKTVILSRPDNTYSSDL